MEGPAARREIVLQEAAFAATDLQGLPVAPASKTAKALRQDRKASWSGARVRAVESAATRAQSTRSPAVEAMIVSLA